MDLAATANNDFLSVGKTLIPIEWSSSVTIQSGFAGSICIAVADRSSGIFAACAQAKLGGAITWHYGIITKYQLIKFERGAKRKTVIFGYIYILYECWQLD